jgi:hypothetical protein
MGKVDWLEVNRSKLRMARIKVEEIIHYHFPDVGKTMPTLLIAGEDLKKLERRLKSEGKKIPKTVKKLNK